MEPFQGRDRDKLIRFGAFEVDVTDRELRHNGKKVKLQDKPFQMLMLLLAEPRKLVSREELRRSLWPADTFVDFEAGLNTAIRKLRDALQDEAKAPRFVETVQRHGYRFIAPIELVVSGKESPQASAGIAPASSAAREISAGSDALARSEAQVEMGRKSRAPVGSLLVPAGMLTAAVLVLLAGLNVAGLRDRLLRKAAERRIQSLAVLPLENLSGDPSQEYFADGMTDALITDLAQVSALRVISRTSVMRYKGTRKPLPEIARELNVDAVVEGSVVRSSNRVRINAQLVQALPEHHLWASAYERDLGDVVALQGEVARAIAAEIQIKLTPQEQTQLARLQPLDPEALEAYMKGRYEWDKWTEEGLNKSIPYFEHAIQKDPAYAQAWAGLSDTYHFLSLWDYWPAEVAMPKAKAAALKAVDLDDTLSDAHVALMGVLWPYEWSAAEKELQRAIALNPNNARAHQAYGYQLSSVARFDEAIAEMERALELDPLAPNKHHSLAATLYRAGRYDEALRHFRQVPDPDANSERRHRFIAAIYERKGLQKEAIAEWLTALRFAGEKDLAEQVERKYVSSGYSEAKKTFLWGDIKEKQKTRARKGFGQTDWIATDYALLGEKDKAFEWLDKNLLEGHIAWDLKVKDEFELLRSDPRFQDLVRRMGLP